MAITDVLKELALATRIIPPVGHPDVKLGTLVPLALTPLPASLDTIGAGDLKAIWLTKDVRFADALGAPGTADLSTYLTDATKIYGGQPVTELNMSYILAPPPIRDLLMPKVEIPDPPTEPKKDLMAGTPGVLGQLSGLVPIPVETPITVSVTWRVMKQQEDGSWADAAEGVDFMAPTGGLKEPTLNLVFLARQAVDLFLPGGLPSPDRFEISADIEVKALGQSSGKVTLPPQLPVPPPPAPPPRRIGIPLNVPAVLGIPRLVAMFRHGQYLPEDRGVPGAVVIGVPENTVIKSVFDLAPVLDTLRDTLKRLQSFKLPTGFASFLLGLDTLIGALDAQPKFQFHMGDHEDLDDIKFSEQGWRVFPPRLPGSEHAEDQISSVIVIGVRRKGIELFGDDNWNDVPIPKHPFSVKLYTGPAMWASIKNFAFVKTIDELKDQVFPLADTLVELDPSPFNDNINDKLSSFRYGER